jgi:hypothetical protein
MPFLHQMLGITAGRKSEVVPASMESPFVVVVLFFLYLNAFAGVPQTCWEISLGNCKQKEPYNFLNICYHWNLKYLPQGHILMAWCYWKVVEPLKGGA